MNMVENNGPRIKARTELKKPRSPVDIEQEKDLRVAIGEDVVPADIIETMAPGADKGRNEEDDDEDITPIKAPGNETGISAGA